MAIGSVTAIVFGLFMLFIALGLPIAFALGGVALISAFLFWGPASLSMVSFSISSLMSNVVLVAIPLFIIMACVLQESGVADDLFDMMYVWFGGLNGGLAIATVLVCTVIAAVTGVVAAATVSMGIIALPAMLERGYDKKMAMGSIMAGGALGPLIPPSVAMVVYGNISGLSIGKLFMGGVFPGLVLSGLFITYIAIRCWRTPSLGPAIPASERQRGWKVRIASLRAVILPVILMISVLGSIFLGLATPTEAAAVGAFGSLICAAVHRRLNWQLLKNAAFDGLKLTGMIMWIIFGATLFSHVYQGLGGPQFIRQMVTAMPISDMGVLIGLQVVFFFLGCVVDTLGILMITYPVFMPLITLYGWDPLWFAMLFFVNVEMGYLTPPFGSNLFYLKGVAPAGISMQEIYKSVIPFVILQAVGLATVFVFPSVATWLPAHLKFG